MIEVLPCRKAIGVSVALLWLLLPLCGSYVVAQETQVSQESPEDTPTVAYPSLACPAGLEPELVPSFAGIMARDSTLGVVTVQFVITAEGKAENIRIVASSGGRNEAIFRRSALRKAARWQYEPMPAACTMIQDIPFNVAGD